MALKKRRPGLVYPIYEDWHYVGETDEPAFQNSWDNLGGAIKCAFRIRETGILDIQGKINGGATPSVAFTLPEGYRPSNQTWFTAIGLSVVGATDTPVLIAVSSAGEVLISNVDVSCDTIWMAGQIFLTPPDAA